MTGIAIRAEGLAKNYGTTQALAGLDMEVPTGEVYGFLGPNGAGKSTTIKLLLDLIRPSGGRVEVLGLDPRFDAVALRGRAGYLSGDFVVDGRQTGAELLTFLGNLRGGVAQRRIEELAERLDLDTGRQIKALSRGNRQKVGLIQAVMHEPELLILDEPTTGLDPFLQHEFAAILRDAADAGRTAFVSSHVMSEVQQFADQVGIIREGQMVTVERVEDLIERSTRQVSIRFENPVDPNAFSSVAGIYDVSIEGNVLTCRLDGRADDLVKAAARYTVITLSVEEPDLEDLFFQYYERAGTSADVAQ